MTISPSGTPSGVDSPYFDNAEEIYPGMSLLGAPLRDAAVDPHPDDPLPPSNAGKPGPLGNPHGPHVVAYEVGSRARAEFIAEQRAAAEQEQS